MTDTVIPAPFWTDAPQGQLFRCAIGTGHVIWLRALSTPLALKAALFELEGLVPDLNFVTVIVSRRLDVP